MKRFEFSLERVRRWRQGQADLEELKLRQLYGELNAIEEEKRRLVAERDQAQAAIIAKDALAAGELLALDSFRHHVLGRSHALEQRRRQQEERVARQRECVIEARRRFELLERMRQRARFEWESAFNKEQEDTASELFLAKMNRDA